MTEEQATAQARKLLSDKTAVAFYDAESPLYPYLIAIATPSGELGVIATGKNYPDALDKAALWQALQTRRAGEPA